MRGKASLAMEKQYPGAKRYVDQLQKYLPKTMGAKGHGLLWIWEGNASKVSGGAEYAYRNVPDICGDITWGHPCRNG